MNEDTYSSPEYESDYESDYESYSWIYDGYVEYFYSKGIIESPILSLIVNSHHTEFEIFEKKFKSLIESGENIDFGATEDINTTSIHHIFIDIFKFNYFKEQKNDEEFWDMLQKDYRKKFELVKYLIDKGANINAINKENKSVLWYVITRGTFDDFMYLINRGAKLYSILDDNYCRAREHHDPYGSIEQPCGPMDAGLQRCWLQYSSIDDNNDFEIAKYCFEQLHLDVHKVPRHHSLLYIFDYMDHANSYDNCIYYEEIKRKSTILLDILIRKGYNVYRELWASDDDSDLDADLDDFTCYDSEPEDRVPRLSVEIYKRFIQEIDTAEEVLIAKELPDEIITQVISYLGTFHD